jgi:Holliday junction resolvase RusA-like endonuclease
MGRTAKATLDPAVSPWLLLVDDWTPPSVNKLWKAPHWSVGHRLKRIAADTIAVALLRASRPIPKATARRRVGIAVRVAGRGGMPDPDNVLKVTLDALKANGMIVDDSARWCEVGTVTVARGPDRFTMISLEDIP